MKDLTTPQLDKVLTAMSAMEAGGEAYLETWNAEQIECFHRAFDKLREEYWRRPENKRPLENGPAGEARAVVHLSPTVGRDTAIGLVIAERQAQAEKWGEDGNKTLSRWVSILAEEVGEVAKVDNKGESTVRGIEELVQVAAVAVAAVEDALRHGSWAINC
jgi:hypothetical protein